jgi:hypothetical protein
MASTFARALRQPLTWLVVAAMVLLSLLALESTGSKHAPSVVPIKVVSNSHANNGNGNGNGNLKHCTDGHGNDGNKNKHCRGISGGTGDQG